MSRISKWTSAGALALIGGFALTKILTSQGSRRALHTLMTDPTGKSSGIPCSATGLQDIIETNLRAEQGRVILRPLEVHVHLLILMGSCLPQLTWPRMSTPLTDPIDTAVTIGKHAPILSMFKHLF